jgi:branched-chain amino acid transport system substrate-binding protein
MINRRSTIKTAVLGAVSVLAFIASGTFTATAANEELKIGFVGVTSGPAAAWGTSNVRSMQTRAAWVNEMGGVKIGAKTYDINIVTFDDQKDPKRAIAGMEKMAQEGIHYVVGPNVDDGAAAVRPVADLPQGALHRAGLQRRTGHDRQLPVRPGDLQISHEKQGREDGRLRCGQRVRSAEPA